MPRYTKRYQVGDWWVGRKSGRPAWYRCRYNPETEQTERVSLGTTDYELACERLDEWFVANHRPQQASADTVTLAEVLGRYYREHAHALPSAQAVRLHSALWLDYWADATLAELTPAAQRRFHQQLFAAGKSASYIQRTVATARAAVNHAWRAGDISQPVTFLTLPASSGIPKGRPLERDEIGALLVAARSDHIIRFIQVLVATAARPGAALDLAGAQCDWQRGLIDLNPPGRARTKKRRPIVRMPRFFLDAFKGHDTNLVSGNAQRIGSVKTAWRRTRERAGLGKDVTPYSIRHTMARELRAASVPAWEVAAQLGHQMPGMTTTEIYAPYDPSYLARAVEAIDEVWTAISK